MNKSSGMGCGNAQDFRGPERIRLKKNKTAVPKACCYFPATQDAGWLGQAHRCFLFDQGDDLVRILFFP